MVTGLAAADLLHIFHGYLIVYSMHNNNSAENLIVNTITAGSLCKTSDFWADYHHPAH